MSRTKRSILTKTGLVLAVVLVAFLTSGVILAQSSSDYDLGCRTDLTAGGTSTTYSGVGVRLHSSVGNWGGGRTSIQGSGIIVQSGYMLASGTDTAAVAASLDTNPDAAGDVFLPAVYALKAIRYVRPCNWPWTSVAQSVQQSN